MGKKDKKKSTFKPLIAAVIGVALMAFFVAIYPRIPIDSAPFVKILQPTEGGNPSDTMYYVQYAIGGIGIVLFLGGLLLGLRGKKNKK